MRHVHRDSAGSRFQQQRVQMQTPTSSSLSSLDAARTSVWFSLIDSCCTGVSTAAARTHALLRTATTQGRRHQFLGDGAGDQRRFHRLSIRRGSVDERAAFPRCLPMYHSSVDNVVEYVAAQCKNAHHLHQPPMSSALCTRIDRFGGGK